VDFDSSVLTDGALDETFPRKKFEPGEQSVAPQLEFRWRSTSFRGSVGSDPAERLLSRVRDLHSYHLAVGDHALNVARMQCLAINSCHDDVHAAGIQITSK
jgi:hypothetical protein